MSKAWQPYALHILDGIEKINRIQARGDILTDDILYDAILRNLQTLSEATQQLPEQLKQQYDQIPCGLSPKIRTMTSMKFPVTLTRWRSHHEDAIFRRTDHQSDQATRSW